MILTSTSSLQMNLLLGSPGSGKSTLASQMASSLYEKNPKISKLINYFVGLTKLVELLPETSIFNYFSVDTPKTPAGWAVNGYANTQIISGIDVEKFIRTFSNIFDQDEEDEEDEECKEEGKESEESPLFSLSKCVDDFELLITKACTDLGTTNNLVLNHLFTETKNLDTFVSEYVQEFRTRVIANTFISKLLEKLSNSFDPSILVIEADKFMDQSTDFKPYRIAPSHALCQKQAELVAIHGCPIIQSNTNLKPGFWKGYLETACKYKYRVNMILPTHGLLHYPNELNKEEQIAEIRRVRSGSVPGQKTVPSTTIDVMLTDLALLFEVSQRPNALGLFDGDADPQTILDYKI